MAGNIIDMSNGKYRLRVSNGFDSNGKRKYFNKTVSCSSKRVAEKELAKFITSIEGGCTYSASKITLNEFSKQWIKTSEEQELVPATRQCYIEKLNLHILPYLGNMRLDKITPFHIDTLYNKLAKKPINRKDDTGNYKTMSQTTIQRVHEVLSGLFSDALRWNLVPFNPCTKVNKPKYKRTKMKCFDEETSKRLINKLLETAPTKYKCFVLLAILGGFRRGEIVGLHWDDIDFGNKKITINRSVYYLGHEGVNEKDTKTDSSHRTVVVPDICFNVLKQ